MNAATRDARESGEGAGRGGREGGKQEQDWKKEDSAYRTRVTCTKYMIEQHVFIYSPLLIKSRALPAERRFALSSIPERSRESRVRAIAALAKWTRPLRADCPEIEFDSA